MVYNIPLKYMVTFGFVILLLPWMEFRLSSAQGDYDYLRTGIGIEARRQKVPQDFSIELVFASARGNYWPT